MGQGCLAKASLNLSLVPPDTGRAWGHQDPQMHIPWVCKQHLLLSSSKIQSKVLCYPTGTQGELWNSAWAVGGRWHSEGGCPCPAVCSQVPGVFLCRRAHRQGINTAVNICFSTQNYKILFQGVERDDAWPFVCLADVFAHLLLNF